ncbi:Ig-like domain-containing protein [Streptomyces sp. x-80]|uniref:Ig-like domain-containing protein n=1 Tax=Streptomyces sp. x-80 TaxID=2789282 RepID=UPI0039813648
MSSTILTRKRRLAAACAFTVMTAVGVVEAAPVLAADKAPVAAVQEAGGKQAVTSESGKKDDKPAQPQPKPSPAGQPNTTATSSPGADTREGAREFEEDVRLSQESVPEVAAGETTSVGVTMQNPGPYLDFKITYKAPEHTTFAEAMTYWNGGANSSVPCSLNGDKTEMTCGPFQLGAAGQGVHSFKLKVDDDAPTGKLTGGSLQLVSNANPDIKSSKLPISVNVPITKAPVIESPAEGATVGQRPTFTGTGVPGATVWLNKASSGTRLGEVKVGAGGKWSISVKEDLPEGDLAVQVRHAESPGAPSETTYWSAKRNVKVEALSAPKIIKPEADSTQPSKVKFEGTADRLKGVTKVKLADKASGKEIGTYSVGSTGDVTGKWWISNSALPEFKPGKHTVTATGITADGETAASEVTFKVLADAPAPVITKPTAGSTVTGPLVKFEGTADSEKGIRKVRLADKATGKEIGTYTVGSTGDIVGKWWISNSVLPEFKPGQHTVTATGITADGETAASEVTFTVK